MNRRKGSQSAVWVSMSEFAYVLVFLSLGGAAILYVALVDTQVRLRMSEEQMEQANERIAKLTMEVEFLQEILREKENAVVPCWRRPDAFVPEVVAIVTITGAGTATIEVAGRANTITVFGKPEVFSKQLRDAVATSMQAYLEYAGVRDCYLRVRVNNETESFAVYEEVVAVLTDLNLVIAND